MKNPLKPVFLNMLFYRLIWGLSILFVLAFLWEFLFVLAWSCLALFVGLIIVDGIILFGPKTSSKIEGSRILPERFSNGDENEVILKIKSKFIFPALAEVRDEIPVQFQIRDFKLNKKLLPGKTTIFKYKLRPVERGEYKFGAFIVFIKGRIGLFSRRYKFNQNAIIKTYPSFIQMRQFEIMAISNRLTELGVRKIRKLGQHSEFDQIRNYIKGDDVRTINWKATARKGQLMVNQYQDEKSQQIFSLIDMGRTMKMPFNGMTLLDYAINTCLIISNIALLKHDKAGLITFNEKIQAMLPARREGQQMKVIMEILYKQESGFLEHNLHALYSQIKHRIFQRSLLILFTNFESLNSALRELPVFKKLATNHLLMVVFFENDEISKLRQQKSDNTEDIYKQAIAEKFIYEKKQIVKEFERNGIYTILTKPENLSTETINLYLEFKAKGII